MEEIRKQRKEGWEEQMEMSGAASVGAQHRQRRATLGVRRGVGGCDRREKWVGGEEEEEEEEERQQQGTRGEEEEGSVGQISVLIDDSEKLRSAWEGEDGGVFIHYVGQDPKEVLESIQEAIAVGGGPCGRGATGGVDGARAARNMKGG